MNPEKQRIAIAEACPNVFRIIGDTVHWRNGWEGEDTKVDPLGDLNAMHEAEKVLGEKRTRSYAFTLAQVLNSSPTVDLDDQFLNINATAAQRAEAFLRTIGKWEEGEE